jgi:hypothetical protein
VDPFSDCFCGGLKGERRQRDKAPVALFQSIQQMKSRDILKPTFLKKIVEAELFTESKQKTGIRERNSHKIFGSQSFSFE